MDAPRREISSERKTLYYIGMAVSVIGFLMFLSTFVTFLMNFGNFNNFEGQVMSAGLRAVGGMAMLIAGGFMMRVGSHGWAGAGVVLDPQRARRDVEPWSRMAGGVASDMISEVPVVQKIADGLSAQKAEVKVRCRQCQALNAETAKFCNQCGAAV